MMMGLCFEKTAHAVVHIPERFQYQEVKTCSEYDNVEEYDDDGV